MSAAAAVKYEQLLKRSESRTQRLRIIRVPTPKHVTSGRRKQSALRNMQKSRNPRSGTAAENTLSRNRVTPKYPFLRNARRGVKYLGERNEPSPSRIIPEQFIMSKFISVHFFTFIHGFSEYYRTISCNFPRYRIIRFWLTLYPIRVRKKKIHLFPLWMESFSIRESVSTPVIKTRLVKTDTYLSCWLVHFSEFRSQWFMVARLLKSMQKETEVPRGTCNMSLQYFSY